MSAPDLATCYDIESPVEKAHAYLFANAGLVVYTPSNAAFVNSDWQATNPDLAPFIIDNEQELQRHRPRVGLRLILGEATGHLAETSPLRCDSFGGSLQIAVVTENNYQLHRAYRAQVRSLMGGNVDSAHMPYHDLNKCVDSGTSTETIDDSGVMVSVLSYEVHVNIKPAAWPE